MPIPVSPAPQLSRTSSTSSIASVDTDASLESITSGVNADVADKAERRTRKRFTNVQLMMLEHLYHQTSHPSREQRDALAKGGDMYVFISLCLEPTLLYIQHRWASSITFYDHLLSIVHGFSCLKIS